MGNAKAALAYIGQFVIWFLAPIIVYFIAKEDKVAKFHAVQALLLDVAEIVIFGILTFLSIIISIFLGPLGLLLIPLNLLVGLVFLVIFLFLTYKGWKNEVFKLPIIGGLAEKWSA